MVESPEGRPRRPFNHEPVAVVAARERAGLNKTQLAQLSGVSQQLISKIESGERNATPRVLARIARAVNLPIVMLEAKRDTTAAPLPTDQATS